MTKINIYCLFESGDNFYGVYSSLKAAHRDAVKICNKGPGKVLLEVAGEYRPATMVELRSIFNGEMDVKVRYTSGEHTARLVKTKLRE